MIKEKASCGISIQVILDLLKSIYGECSLPGHSSLGFRENVSLSDR